MNSAIGRASKLSAVRRKENSMWLECESQNRWVNSDYIESFWISGKDEPMLMFQTIHQPMPLRFKLLANPHPDFIKYLISKLKPRRKFILLSQERMIQVNDVLYERSVMYD